MKLEFYASKWGFEAEPIDAFCERVRSAGFDGVEVTLPPDPDEAGRTADAIRGAGLGFIALRWSPPLVGFEQNLEEYGRHLRVLAAVEPEFINAHTGIDWYEEARNDAFLTAAAAVTSEFGVAIHHETHRGRFAFSAATTQRYLERHPELTLTADFSHWCCVSESLLEDQQTSVDAAIERVEHVHCRVGYSQGPQISDPRAPEWSAEVEAHLRWWRRIIDRHRARGSDRLTLTPEFGPWPYMVEQPHTREPLADLWAVNCSMRERLQRELAST